MPDHTVETQLNEFRAWNSPIIICGKKVRAEKGKPLAGLCQQGVSGQLRFMAAASVAATRTRAAAGVAAAIVGAA
jgi:hypothetical protein